MSYPLEPTPEQMRVMGDAALSFVIDHIAGLPDAPSWGNEGWEEMAARVRGSAPEDGRGLDQILADLGPAVAKSFNTAGPGYLAFIPGGGLFAAALADLIADAVNRYVGLWFPAPALATIEWSAIRWLCDVFAYPAHARGILTSGGSLSNFSAVVTARHELLGDDLRDGTIYVTEHTHHSVVKSATLAGIPAANVRRVACRDDLSMDPDGLARAIGADRAAGARPFMVVASMGTTNTGAIDPIADVIEVARGLWVHADAAYGGFFHLTERGRRALAGIEHADSITLDPHKGMFLPYGTGALLVRDGQKLRAAHSEGADTAYLQDLAADAEIPNFTEYSPELSRDFRGLRVWLPIQLHGLRAFRAALDEKLDLTERLYQGLKAIPELEIPWEPGLTIVAFRLRDADNGANRAFLDHINASKRVFLSSTMLDGRFTLRACIVSHRTHADRIDEAIEIIARAARA